MKLLQAHPLTDGATWTTRRGRQYRTHIYDNRKPWLLDDHEVLIVVRFEDDNQWWITTANDEIDFDPVGPFPTSEAAAVAALMMSS